MKSRLICPAIFLLLAICNTQVNAQQTFRQFTAKRTTAPIKMDGEMSEAAWKTAPVINNFILMRPNPGKPEDQDSRTEMYVLYDNEAVYFAGFCHERSRDSVAKELVGRDKVGSNDFVGIFIDSYHDRINAVGFFCNAFE